MKALEKSIEIDFFFWFDKKIIKPTFESLFSQSRFLSKINTDYLHFLFIKQNYQILCLRSLAKTTNLFAYSSSLIFLSYLVQPH